MAKPAQRSPECKLLVVLSVSRGEVSVAKAARRAGVPEQTVHNTPNPMMARRLTERARCVDDLVFASCICRRADLMLC